MAHSTFRDDSPAESHRARSASPSAHPVGVDVRAPRFAAGITSAVLAIVGISGYAAGVPLLGAIATGAALLAALLNAAFGICLGCRMYPLVAYLRMP